MFLRSTDLRFTTSPAIATYTLLPPGLLCLQWFVGLFVATFFIVISRAMGHFLNFFFSCFGFVSSLTKLWDVSWLALAMCLQNLIGVYYRK